MSSYNKSLPLGVGLNIVLPGAGYIYLGRWFLGLIAGALILAIVFSAPAQNAFVVWLVMNVIMLVDMFVLHSKNKKKNLIPCKACAESIKKDAKICRYCKEAVVNE